MKERVGREREERVSGRESGQKEGGEGKWEKGWAVRRRG